MKNLGVLLILLVSGLRTCPSFPGTAPDSWVNGPIANDLEQGEEKTAIEQNVQSLKQFGKCMGCILVGSDLSGLDLSGADLSHAIMDGVNLSGADLSGALFYKASVRKANFRGAITKKTNFSNADLSGAEITFSEISILCNTIEPNGKKNDSDC